MRITIIDEKVPHEQLELEALEIEKLQTMMERMAQIVYLLEDHTLTLDPIYVRGVRYDVSPVLYSNNSALLYFALTKSDSPLKTADKFGGIPFRGGCDGPEFAIAFELTKSKIQPIVNRTLNLQKRRGNENYN